MNKSTGEKGTISLRWERAVLAVLCASTVIAPMSASASDKRSGDSSTESRGQSLDQLGKADRAAAVRIAQANLAQQSLGFQASSLGVGSVGEQAAVELRAKILAARLAILNSIRKESNNVVTFPNGATQKTVSNYDPSTGKLSSSTTELKDKDGALLAKGASVYSDLKDGSLQVKTTLEEGTSVTETTTVRKPDGSVTITGQTREGSPYYPKITDFTTKIDAQGNLRRTFKTVDTGTHSTTTGVQENNVTTTQTTRSTGNSSETVSTVLAGGIIRSVTVSRHFDGNGVYTETRETEVTKSVGIMASLSPFEPARFFGKIVPS